MKTLSMAVVLTLAALALPVASLPAQPYYDQVVIVLDASGSMTQPLPGTRMTKMTAAKDALKAVLQKVPASTHIGLLVFSAANLKDDWVYPLGPRDDAVLIQAIDRIQASAGTPLGFYIKKGTDRLLAERAKQFGYGSYRLIVVTDGEAQDQDLVNKYTPDVLSRGITLDVIGVAMKQDHTLAKRAHSYRRANDPASLSRALNEVFAEVVGTGTDVAQLEAFAALAPIPVELASAMIQALANSGNHPIGTRPASAAAKPGAGTAPPPPRPPQARPPAPPATSVPVRPPAQPLPTPQRSSRSFRLMAVVPGLFCFAMFAGSVIVVAMLIRKGARR